MAAFCSELEGRYGGRYDKAVWSRNPAIEVGDCIDVDAMVDKERDFEHVLCGQGDEEVKGRVSLAGP